MINPLKGLRLIWKPTNISGSLKISFLEKRKTTNKYMHKKIDNLPFHTVRKADAILESEESWPTATYKNPWYAATPQCPRLLEIEVHRLHLLVCGSRYSIDLRHEHPSRPPIAYNLEERHKRMCIHIRREREIVFTICAQSENERTLHKEF